MIIIINFNNHPIKISELNECCNYLFDQEYLYLYNYNISIDLFSKHFKLIVTHLLYYN
jgi:hypothetical protein